MRDAIRWFKCKLKPPKKADDVVELRVMEQNFSTRIMTHYFPALSMTPEDDKVIKELNKNLFTFIMSRTEYTQVITFLNLAYIFIEKLLTI